MDTNTAFLAYGVHVGGDGQEAERIDEVLLTFKDRCPNVHSAVGGSCLGEEVFLVAYSKQVASGGHGRAAGISPEQQAGWDVQLADSTRVLGYTGRASLQRPAWLCSTELS
ncbi:hypothetical protein [Streptomyces ortus]|uniref:Uncharacterized protein n=1 Tax=Streptomyces ortus TaxID=2867268 RepID=A0ABT3V0C8_9ACTN|nr:hypothetical protein [Streptomyces ortus]MCX4231748.1 hypothetical protein [Streptomyces ortus]